MPCVLCPNDVDYDDLLPTDNGLKAHRTCADYTPETYISAKPNEVVCNVANIGKDRLELKCNYCRSKRGAVFQCSQKKCTRAFHATCAVAAGVQVDLGVMQTFDAEGTEYFYDGYDFRCRFHRPKKRNNKTVDVESLEKNKFVMNYGKTLVPKDVIQFQYVGGEMYQIYGAQVVENRPGEQSVLVDVLPDGDRVEVEWKYILKLHPDESQRPKPSANAKPLPEHLKENDASLDITNRTDGVPEIGDPFQDPNSEHKWAEWNTAPEVTRKIAKVDLALPRMALHRGKAAVHRKSCEAKEQPEEQLHGHCQASTSAHADIPATFLPCIVSNSTGSYCNRSTNTYTATIQVYWSAIPVQAEGGYDDQLEVAGVQPRHAEEPQLPRGTSAQCQLRSPVSCATIPISNSARLPTSSIAAAATTATSPVPVSPLRSTAELFHLGLESSTCAIRTYAEGSRTTCSHVPVQPGIDSLPLPANT
jgi:hypothetical protein